MDIGIIGLPQSGKTTIFNSLTKGSAAGSGHGGEVDKVKVGMAKVPDPRLQQMADIFNPKKIVMAEVRYTDVPLTPRGLGKGEGFGSQLLNVLTMADALLHVVRAFDNPSVAHIEGSIDPYRDIDTMNLELTYSDLTILERRRARIVDSLKGARSQERDALLKEQGLIDRIRDGLEREVAIRDQSFSPDEQKALNNYQFLTAKPILLVLNIGEKELPNSQALEEELERRFGGSGVIGAVVCGKLEEELAQLDEVEAGDFRSVMGGGEPATEKVLRLSFQLLGLVSFLTCSEKDVRAWPIPRDTGAVKAAGKVHSDIEKGFIRAEVVGYDDMVSCGSIVEARKRGVLRLEGKSYKVQDGDIINFLFKV